MAVTFNSERPRGAAEDNGKAGKTLAVQSDDVDRVMADAIYGRTLSQDEIELYTQERIHFDSEDREKTIFERVDDAVRRCKDRNEAPCCRDKSEHYI